jgi:hypothetical protein
MSYLHDYRALKMRGLEDEYMQFGGEPVRADALSLAS